MPQTATPAPDFELLNQDGQAIKLSDLRGQKVIIFAYPKAGTPGCTTQACGFREVFPQIQTHKARVFGVSPDSVQDLKKWQAEEGFPYDLLSDPDHAMMAAWGAWGERSMYGKTYMGVIRSHWVIDEEGRVLDEQIKVSPKDSVALALKAIGG
jgi:peroxiredoxin Q/BCP